MGGKNSSNSSHLVELCEKKLPTYFIDDANKIIDQHKIERTNWQDKTVEIVEGYLPSKPTISILMTSGASCPDTVVEAVIKKIASFYNLTTNLDAQIKTWVN
jgi:4-hydroxy-3-methylbut-2-enyl diphosphate reductase